MSTHLHQKLAFVTHPQIHASASWASVYDVINRLDMYIKSSLWLWARCLKNAFVQFFKWFIFETKNSFSKYVLSTETSKTLQHLRCCFDKSSSRLLPAIIYCQKKFHLSCCRSSRPTSKLCQMGAIVIWNI